MSNHRKKRVDKPNAAFKTFARMFESLWVLFPAPWGEKNRQAEFRLNTPLSSETRKSSVKREGLPRGFLLEVVFACVIKINGECVVEEPYA